MWILGIKLRSSLLTGLFPSPQKDLSTASGVGSGRGFFPIDPSPSPPYILSTTPMLLCWNFSWGEEAKKELKHSWFLVNHRWTHSALASCYPFLFPPLNRRVVFVELNDLKTLLPLFWDCQGHGHRINSVELHIWGYVLFTFKEREIITKATYRRKDLFWLTVSGYSPSQQASHDSRTMRWPMSARIQRSFLVYYPELKDGEQFSLSSHLSWHHLGMSP